VLVLLLIQKLEQAGRNSIDAEKRLAQELFRGCYEIEGLVEIPLTLKSV
jgi:hypothetical protein